MNRVMPHSICFIEVYNGSLTSTIPTLKYEDLSQCNINVDTTDKAPTGITMSSQPTKTNYIQGQNLDVTGAKITVTYNDGSTQTVDVTPSMVSGYSANQVGTQPITVTYNGQTTTFTVNVIAKAVTGITMSGQPTNTSYIQGQNLVVTGAKIIATYNDGSNQTVDITPSMVSGYNANQVGTQPITVTYNGQTTTFTVNVIATYTVSFNKNDGSRITSQVLKAGTKIQTPTNPIRAGYIFNGWFTKATGGTRVTFPYTVTGNVTFFAQWTSFAGITPSGVKVTVTNYNTVQLSWNTVTGATSYKVSRATTAAGTPALVATVTSTSYTNTSLNTGTTYYYKIVACQTVGSVTTNSKYSAVVSAKPTLSAPIGVKVVKASTTSAKVTWTATSGAGGYTVYYSTTATGTFTAVNQTTTSYTKTGLTKGKTYYFKVMAYRIVGSTKVYSGSSTTINVKM